VKTVVICSSLVLLISVPVFAGESKVYTDTDLEQYQTGNEEETWEYNQEVLQDILQKETESNADEKRRKRCEKLLHPETLPKGKGFASALMGIAEGKSQLNAYNDCLAGVQRKPVRIKQSKYGYQDISGKKYQYDLSNPNDRLQYQVDPGARLRDSIDPDPRRNIDQGVGQYGGGGK